MARGTEDLTLWNAAKRGSDKKLRRSISSRGALLNQPHPVKGTTPLMVAATKKSGIEAVRVLIELGAQLDAVDSGKHKNTALHYAAYNNRVAQLELLLNAGASIFALNAKGHSPLDVARLRDRKEASSALTARLEMHSGWLHLRSKSLLGMWKRRWCVLLACNQERTTTELCVFHDPGHPHPDSVIWLESSMEATCCPASSNERANGFTLDQRVVYQRLSHRRYSRYQSSGRLHGEKGKMEPREFLFACDTEANRDAWMSVLGRKQHEQQEQRQELPPEAPGSFIGVVSSSRSSERPRAVTFDVTIPPPSVPDAAPLVEEYEDLARVFVPVDKPAPLPMAQDSPRIHETRPLASAPTFIGEEEEAPLFGGFPPAANASAEEEAFPLATVISLGGDPMASQSVSREAECIVCMENARDALCVPCGHASCCYDCLRAITSEDPSCPICRANVEGVVKINDC
ncbi:hypothetical protein BBJ28_00018562 [Nothophytophthora sp. Chile5]|nr:hypothetical protein BBJ28_00018562 [Nothophytophthora sp. Chile5]